jgi:voltage-gated potassium channel
VTLTGFENVERRHVVLTAARAVGTSALVLAAYFAIPIRDHPHGLDVVRLSAGLALFVVVLLYEVRAILRSPRPMLRAADAMALVIPIFVAVFAWTYLTMAKASPRSFTQPLDRVSALYFTVTVFTTVGFGDITPVSDAARLTVTAQMVCDVLVIAAVVRLILEAGRGALGRRTSATDNDAA